jgi:hypothetical protein
MKGLDFSKELIYNEYSNWMFLLLLIGVEYFYPVITVGEKL